MASRSKRRKARNTRQRRSDSVTSTLDSHAEVMVGSLKGLVELMGTFTGDDPAAEIDAAFDMAISELATKLGRFDAIRLIEVARQRFLPLVPVGKVPVVAEAGAAYLELLALVALAARQEMDTAAAPAVEPQEMSHFVAGAKDELDRILHLAQLSSFAGVDPSDQLAMVSLLIRGSEVWMRNSSYPEMVQTTNLALLDGDPDAHETS